MTQKKHTVAWVLLGIGILILGGIFALAFSDSFEVSETDPTERESEDVDTVTNLVWRTEEVGEESVDENYAITVRYPVFEREELALLTMLIEDFVEEEIRMFKAETSEPGILPSGIESTLDISYSVTENPFPGFVNVLFEEVWYTGGAHPNTVYTAFVFDIFSGSRVSLSDIFDSASDYLDLLSTASRERLIEKLGTGGVENTIVSGTEPQQENFNNFLLHAETIELIFNPYQVAPYAAGVQRVLIPYSYFGDRVTLSR